MAGFTGSVDLNDLTKAITEGVAQALSQIKENSTKEQCSSSENEVNTTSQPQTKEGTEEVLKEPVAPKVEDFSKIPKWANPDLEALRNNVKAQQKEATTPQSQEEHASESKKKKFVLTDFEITVKIGRLEIG